MAQQYDTMNTPPRLPLVIDPQNRNHGVSKDARLVNCYVETTNEEDAPKSWIYKRPGITTQSQPPGGAARGFGVYLWKGDVYSIFENVLYRNGVSVSTALDTSNGVYQFNKILGATPKMLLGNGAKSYAYETSGGLTADLHTLNVNYPATTCKGFAYLNGATYVVTNFDVIWGSAVNDVTSVDAWTALDFISAQMDPDDGIAIAQQLAYVLAFNSNSVEVFFDAGNATGSPLGSVQGAKISYGCASADSIQIIDDRIMWLANTDAGQLQIAMVQGLNSSIISTKPIERLLENTDLTTVFSWQLKTNGHSFYVITIKNNNLTLCFDISENRWYQWTDADGNYFPIVASCTDRNRLKILQHETNGKLYYVSDNYVNDDGQLITCDIYTPIFDGNSSRKKTMSMMTFVADQEPGSILSVRCSDDDYRTWSNYRMVDLGQVLPNLTNCGTFRKRAYNMRHRCNTSFRIEAVEVQYDMGTL